MAQQRPRSGARANRATIVPDGPAADSSDETSFADLPPEVDGETTGDPRPGHDPGSRAVAALHEVLGARAGTTHRPQQEEMVREVAAALDARRHLLVQAGTGVGKSLGYLVPALVGGRRVVVATATRQLQDQLVGQDLPLAERIAVRLPALGPATIQDDEDAESTPEPVPWALLKGRQNYLCELKVSQLADEVPDDGTLTIEGLELPDDPFGLGGRQRPRPEDLRPIRVWAKRTITGDRADLPDPVPDHIWDAVSTDSRSCPGRRDCPAGATCFAELARDRARIAAVTVVNHALVAADLRSAAMERPTMLGDWAALVVDEAHAFEESLSSAWGLELSARSLRSALSAAVRRAPADGDRRARAAAVATSLAADVAALEDQVNDLPPGRLTRVPEALGTLLRVASGRFDQLAKLLGGPESDSEQGVDTQEALRRMEGRNCAELAAGLLIMAGDEDLTGGGEVGTDRGAAATTPAPGRAPAAGRGGEAPTRAGRPGTPAGDPDSGAGDDSPRSEGGAFVRWLDQGRAGAGPTLRLAPLSVGGMLRAALGERPLIAVSATLSVGGSFVPLARAMGLPPGSWDGVDLGTPFDYDRQAMLYIPGATFPVPAGQQRNAHTEAVREELLALIGAAGGRTLALFTTTAAARDAGAFLRSRLPMTVLVQGDEPPKRLVERFVAEETSVLCATMGMWQGTDAPGATCILVVLDKIPFPPVDDPLLQARRAAADENGRSGFADVDLVHAGVRLAQGAGRLVRTSQDRGVVAILDPRLVTRRYGSTLRAGLPMRRLWHDRSVVEGALKRLAADAGAVAGSAPTEDTPSDRPKPRARPRRRAV